LTSSSTHGKSSRAARIFTRIFVSAGDLVMHKPFGSLISRPFEYRVFRSEQIESLHLAHELHSGTQVLAHASLLGQDHLAFAR
jgi:hypothetical protein